MAIGPQATMHGVRIGRRGREGLVQTSVRKIRCCFRQRVCIYLASDRERQPRYPTPICARLPDRCTRLAASCAQTWKLSQITGPRWLDWMFAIVARAADVPATGDHLPPPAAVSTATAENDKAAAISLRPRTLAAPSRSFRDSHPAIEQIAPDRPVCVIHCFSLENF
jgi:hypothetical protein